jgi:hypothetical protein
MNKSPTQLIYVILIAGLLAAGLMLFPSPSTAGGRKEMREVEISGPMTPEDEPLYPYDVTAKKIKEIEANKGRRSAIHQREKIIDDYLSTKVRSIDRSSIQYPIFLNDVWNDRYPELETSDIREPVLYYVVTVFGIEPATDAPTVDADRKTRERRNKLPNVLPIHAAGRRNNFL